MAAEETIEQTYSVSRPNLESRTFLGGIRLNSRIFLFIIFGIIALLAMGGLFINADQRLSFALNSLKSSQQIVNLVSRVETDTFAVNSDSQNFLIRKKNFYAEDYNKNSSEAAILLTELRNLPAALDSQKILTSLIEGITQHATHFQNLVRLQSFIGVDEAMGLIGNAGNSGQKLQQRVLAIRNIKLIGQVNELRKLETDLQDPTTPDDVNNIMGAVTNIRQSVMASTLPTAVKTSIIKDIEPYANDLEQLAQTRLIQEREIQRMEEVATYVMSNLKALTTFAVNLSDGVRRSSEETQTEVRKILAGGASIIMVFLIFLGIMLMRSIVKPVSSLAEAAMQLTHGNQSVIIPALGNLDETGEMAIALTKFQENMTQADRLRKELELYLQDADDQAQLSDTKPSVGEEQAEETILTTEKEIQLKPEFLSSSSLENSSADLVKSAPQEDPVTISRLLEDRELQTLDPGITRRARQSTPISQISQMLAQTSQSASSAAKDVERCDSMVSDLGQSSEKINEIELLLASIRDHMSLLAVQIAITNETGSDDTENLKLLTENHLDEIDRDQKASDFVSENLETLQSNTKRAIRAIQQVGQSIKKVNEVALELAAEASNEALDAATELLHQSEDLRSMLDELLVKIKPGDYTESTS